MDPHAVTACLPWSGRGREGEKRKREREGDTFTTIVTVLTTATATYAPAPGAGRPANGIMLNPRRGKFATRRRDVYLRAVSSSREICRVQPAYAFSGWQFDQDRESREGASMARFRASYGRCAHRLARNQTDFSYTDIFIRKCYMFVWEQLQAAFPLEGCFNLCFCFNDSHHLFVNSFNIEY